VEVWKKTVREAPSRLLLSPLLKKREEDFPFHLEWRRERTCQGEEGETRVPFLLPSRGRKKKGRLHSRVCFDPKSARRTVSFSRNTRERKKTPLDPGRAQGELCLKSPFGGGKKRSNFSCAWGGDHPSPLFPLSKKRGDAERSWRMILFAPGRKGEKKIFWPKSDEKRRGELKFLRLGEKN